MIKLFSKKIVKFAFLFTLALLHYCNFAIAMSVNPVVLDMKAAGSQTRTQINVINTLTYELPVEITINEIVMDENGKTTAKKAGAENFLIFPPQALIKSGATQVFRVQWVGEPDIAESKTYMFSVAQLPVELDKGVNGIQLLYNFQVVANVAPAKAKPELSLLGTDIKVDDKGVPHPVLSVQNSGAAHAYVSATRLKLEMLDKAGKSIWKQTYEPSELGQTLGLGLVQPGKKRNLVLPFKLPQKDGTIKASFRYIGRR